MSMQRFVAWAIVISEAALFVVRVCDLLGRRPEPATSGECAN